MAVISFISFDTYFSQTKLHKHTYLSHACIWHIIVFVIFKGDIYYANELSTGTMGIFFVLHLASICFINLF